ncbi:MAG: YetF domain-containing protein [Pseudobdellovibrio sp.]
MWNNLVHMDVSVFNFIIRAIVVYFSVLVLLRVGGKRQIGQMGPTEFVAMLLISNAVQNAMNAGDNSLAGGLVLAVTLVSLSTLISYLTFKFKFFEKVFEGVPTLLIHHGKLIEKNMNKEHLSPAELQSMIRKQGVHQFHDISTAILEADGTLTLVKHETTNHVQPT